MGGGLWQKFRGFCEFLNENEDVTVKEIKEESQQTI